MDITGKRGKTSRRVRLADLAGRAGVSVATVSRALSGGPVDEDTARRIQRLAQDMGYAMPASMAGRRVVVLASAAAMVDFSRSQFTFGVMQGLAERAGLMRVDLVTRAVADPAEEAAALAEAAADASVAGLLFLTLDDAAMLAPTRGFPKPIVLVNGDDQAMQLSSVAPSNRAAGALATGHLQGLGHRRILFLTRPGRRTIERRREGWRDRMGPEAGGLLVEVADWEPALAAAAVADRLARGRDFTAILAASDSLATGALQALAAAGLRVPGDVSVVGMDGLPQGAFLTPPLSAVRMPTEDIGRAAMDLLRDLATGLPLPARRVELACAMLPRGSCGPAPG
jgi:DNA-binding LacI/PurR family transcriptional regulator